MATLQSWIKAEVRAQGRGWLAAAFLRQSSLIGSVGMQVKLDCTTFILRTQPEHQHCAECMQTEAHARRAASVLCAAWDVSPAAIRTWRKLTAHCISWRMCAPRSHRPSECPCRTHA